jgi:hypothetical protein
MEGVRARDVFLALRPGIDVFLDLVCTLHAKALRMAAEAGLPRWTQPERIAALLAVADEHDAVMAGLRRRLLASIRVDVRPAALDRCMCIRVGRAIDEARRVDELEARRGASEKRACWMSCTGAVARRALVARGLHGLLADRVFDLAVASEADRLLHAADNVRADHLQAQMDTEVRRAESVFFADEGEFSKEAFASWASQFIRQHQHGVWRPRTNFLSSALMSALWSGGGGIGTTDVTPQGNKYVTVFQISVHGRRWTLARVEAPPSTPADARVERELIAFVVAFRTRRQPGDYSSHN